MARGGRGFLEAYFGKERVQIPTQYLWGAEQILKGNQELLWGLLWHIMHCYPQSVTDLSRHYSSKQESLYSPVEMRKLEASIIFWLNTLGLLPDPASNECLELLRNKFSDGTLLCDLVGLMEGRQIVGVYRKPLPLPP